MKHLFTLLSTILFFVAISVNAQSPNTNKLSAADYTTIKTSAYADSARLVAIFKDIHENPELGFMETRTAAIVAHEFKKMGYEVTTGIGVTGIVAILKNGAGPTVMYRADMDCNAVKETTGLPYASTKTVKKEDGAVVPVMHACGHDAHTTWMLGIAKIMVNMKARWQGTLIFVAQPAEELGTGAEAMVIDEKYIKGVPIPDYLFGMHTAPFPVGYISNGSGERMAGVDQLDVTFFGIGGHGSSPHLAKDPILMGALAIVEYQAIISRAIDPQNAAVLTVGAFQSGIDNNVIPGSALLKLNLRWFNEKDRTTMIEGIKRINESIAMAYNLPKDLYPTIKMKGMAYPLINNKEMVTKVNAALVNIIAPEKNFQNIPAVMGSEDFHHLVIHNKKSVYDYMLVGIANPEVAAKATKEGKVFPFSNHNSDFQVDLSAIPLGTAIGATGLMQLFKD